jgi:hypothetical protein
MEKKVNIKALKVKGDNGKIKTDLKETNYDFRRGKFAFEFVCDNRCCLSDWQGQELKLLIDSFKKVEKLTWQEIFVDQGLKWERNKNIAIPLPNQLPKDTKLCSFRVNQKMRIYGYRAQELFYIVWFDKNHIVCPEGKSKKYPA